LKIAPKLVIFDVDGVLVDVRGSFHRSIIETIHFFTGRRVTYAEIHQWKNRSGYNDDWRLTTDWISSLGKPIPYAQVKARFQKLYWGTKDQPGNVSREKWLVAHSRLERWSRRADLALFTGRTRHELRHTLERSPANGLFRRAVTLDDVKKGKPDQTPARAEKRTASRFYQLKSGHALTGVYLKSIDNRPDDYCWWCDLENISGTPQTRDHLFKHCSRWKDQQAQLWERVKKETRKGKQRWRVGDLLADERCSPAVLDFLRTTYVGRAAPPG